MTTRRRFLTGAAAAFGGAAFGLPRFAHASLAIGSEPCPYKILEIFLNAGFSHRETLWMRAAGMEDSFAAPSDLGAIDASLADAEPTGFAVGLEEVWLGPCVAPLAAAGLLPRVRLVALGHGLDVHEVAQDYALTGVAPGRPGYSSLGARISTRWGGGDLPASYVIGGSSSDAVRRPALEVGELGSQNRPLLIPMSGNALKQRLNRGDRAVADSLLGMHRDVYADRLEHPSFGRVRSKTFDVYDHAVSSIFQSPELLALLQGAPDFAAIGGDYPNEVGPSSVRVGTYLLANGARHACVLSPGLPDGRDTHNNSGDTFSDWGQHSQRHTGHLWAVFQALVDAINDGELDLDNTLVCINTEFGRYPRSDVIGSNHHTEGYAALLLGGPVASPGLVGDIDYGLHSQGRATGGFVSGSHTPTDLMAALTLAAGIDPFGDELFDIGDTSFGSGFDTESALDLLREELLGAEPGDTCDVLTGETDDSIDDVTL